MIVILNHRYRCPRAFQNLHFPLFHGPNFERHLDLSYALPGRLPSLRLSWDMPLNSLIYKLCREARLVSSFCFHLSRRQRCKNPLFCPGSFPGSKPGSYHFCFRSQSLDGQDSNPKRKLVRSCAPQDLCLECCDLILV